MSDLTYPFLLEFYNRGKTHISPGSMEWIVSQCRAAAGGKAYPANQPITIDDDHAIEGVTDKQAYARVFNACARLLGHDLADQVAREAVGTVATIAQPELEPEDLTATEADLEGLTPGQEALFRWGLAGVSVGIDTSHTQEIYGKGKEPPEYVPKAKRKKWIAMFNAILRSTGDEQRAFAITNARFVEKK